MDGLGESLLTSILSNPNLCADDPFLCSPAFLNQQNAAVAASVAAAPSSPGSAFESQYGSLPENVQSTIIDCQEAIGANAINGSPIPANCPLGAGGSLDVPALVAQTPGLVNVANLPNLVAGPGGSLVAAPVTVNPAASVTATPASRATMQPTQTQIRKVATAVLPSITTPSSAPRSQAGGAAPPSPAGFLTDSMIGGIPNWVLLAGLVAAIVVLPRMLSRSH